MYLTPSTIQNSSPQLGLQAKKNYNIPKKKKKKFQIFYGL